MSLRIGIVVGEASGDNLAASLISELKNIYPNLEIEGIVGPKLMALGGKTLFPMASLSVMGLIEPLARLPELFKIRRWLVNYFIEEPPDLFIGIDAPDFNLGLEKQLKKSGIPTVHYVSPSVWAWRESRLRAIKKAVDLMLTLFPFEEVYYQRHNIPVKFVGHPAADQILIKIDTIAAKLKLGFKKTDKIIALMPGSRKGELKHLAKLYLQVAKLCLNVYPDLKFVMPLVSLDHQAYINELQAELREELQKMQHEEPQNTVNVQTLVGMAYDVVAASDIVLVTSGTATLEVMLHKKPMVIAYKTGMLTYEIIKRLIKVSFIGLPNLLANAPIVPELIQSKATPELLSKELLALLDSEEKRQKQIYSFSELHSILRKGASVEAARAIVDMLG